MSFVSTSMLPASTVPSAASIRGTDPLIDSQGFLKLLLTQLQHQDPTMPTDPGNTVLQLAALSQVSALQEISALLKELLDSKKSPDTTPSNSRRDGSSKTSSELSLLGHADAIHRRQCSLRPLCR